ncbi:methyl-accepting chemotaxis protein [Clostridium saccharobutylicum]|uniref:Methyl-accepting chemotaxis protein McpC n=3 Tax=Clostridium saccharobutylicum TaxID=169679 RepID=U5MKQ9_CLOSA|nr:methyl-accepting chemotaxis protein [Clostridium saccharobutylicum]AGX41369.1 methyl-accepting chemotaxis protein McpC [Clostridium saccharobutylicum DSM 13864]AQR88650.1 methyl-accepting chemotaxis protein McpC [Clostridium saccharobutylicum]AQR98548.1 methyl-accepting chemotaxis protein McpC [Clostridium saccharobutylicum]AQS12538.1 methyl-accepting chemotaxis protein McpC [Clostridium saccharobutylicum]MBA2905557.1 methyl-accepting chemotaxis protein [Clostridium saccharobutylicum]
MQLKKMKFNNIRSKLIISLVGICIIPLIILGYGSYLQSKSILSQKLAVTSQQTLSEVNNGIDNYFYGFENMVTMLATNYDVVNSDNSINASFIPGVLQNAKEIDNDIFSAYFGTADGGFQIYPNNKMPDGFDPRERTWYKQALDNKGKVIITLPFKDAQTGKNVVSVARTVERDGKVIGVCAMNVSLETLTEKISSKKIGDSGYAFVSDLEGNIIAHPQKELLGTNEASKLSIWNDVKSSNNGFVNYTYNNITKFAAYQTNSTTGWKVITTLNEQEISKDTRSILFTTLIIILVMAVISIFMSLILSKGIANNLKKLKAVFAKASEGDLTVSISASTNDEFMDLADSFNSMIQNISELMNSVTKSSKEVLETSSNLASMSEEVTASIGEVAKAIEEVSEGATNQSQNAQNGASEMNELSDRLDKISVNSNEMDKLSNNTKDLGSKGLSMIDTLIEKSNKTKIATNEVNEIVQDMNESTKKINTISETIAEITEQTGLLSLNASIESARAGEAGKGFAVVAEEIGKLAEQSKNSTEEIKLIIANIQEKSDTAVKAIKSTENVVNEQDLAVGQTQIIFSEILDSISIMIDKVEEVKLSIVDINEKKQSTLMEIENISSISEETASASEEVTASTEEITAAMDKFTKYADSLQLLAEKLESEINKFRVE